MSAGSCFTRTITFVILDCYKCGCLFAVPEAVKDEWKTKGQGFYCPNGHQQYFCESVRAQLNRTKRLLEQQRARNLHLREQYEASERSNTALRGVVTKKNKQLDRVAKGTCPCCHRHFANLARHMRTKHPNYKP